ncbi:xylose isomerase [Paenibacillus sp. FSL P4-0081]|jgi:sugar phosphate isomerase/epimerase|uniref:sugar phosphate isomerase/epimerase family protein n=1 Tax=Paenibacillus TaxID=44249 RepID=UPI0004F6C8DB|nr:sugar phosphate isomerase/epimerase family protein [Paenibacillus sp. FSL P4-0081]AIQ29167.1 xylose isomerase [Paenibacillus sp. FSL P4-0081]OMF23952.1 xylose isomerase [Paenibacillus sp. FSL H8-0259]
MLFIRYGTLAHTAGCLPLKELTATLQTYDIDFVQLALAKAIQDIDLSPGKLSPGLASYIGEQFDKAGIRIGVLGCYINPIHPDPAIRRVEIDRFKEHLRYARQFGAPMVATETGALTTFQEFDPYRYEEIGWDALKATVEELAEEAEKWGVFLALEGVCTHTLSSPAKMRRILDEVPSSSIGVVLDPCNLIGEEVHLQDEIVDSAFSLFGDRIILAHLKDIYKDGTRIRHGASGQGLFHTTEFLNKLEAHKPMIDVSLEEVTGIDIKDTVTLLRNLRH